MMNKMLSKEYISKKISHPDNFLIYYKPYKIDRNQSYHISTIHITPIRFDKLRNNKHTDKVSYFEKHKNLIKESKVQNLVTALRNYLDLYYDWDGYQGIAPQVKTVEESIRLVQKLPDSIPLPKPMVSGTGIVGLFWGKNNIYAEICFEGDGTFWYYGNDGNFEIGEESVSLKEEIILPADLINLINKI
ncbi:hypothetical protein [Nodularia sp. UHCC 0506]|uniref:hypothetical protein n=1 Tax=Nodularia sp. UHCC 0506 TaxID=3110243 RepID=UPI002B20B3C0|nr:hypothetical protein [Nodularia sp. UHCC 0506]MEA5512975.1 hypothetical protein [Nodularia sp. UHCC 0506]